MIKSKRIIKLATIITLSMMLLSGCTTKDIEAVKSNTPEEAIEQFDKYNTESNIEEMVKLYSDVYVDSVGYTRGEIVKMLKNNRSSGEIVKTETINIEDVNENLKKATVSITSKEKNEDKEEVEVTNEYQYGIIKEGDGWAVSPDGVYKCIDFDIPAYKEKELNLNLAKQISVFDGEIIRINLVNDSKKQMVFGKENNYSKVIVETNEGTFETVIEQVVPIDKRSQTYFMTKINGLKGEIQKVTVTSIYEGDGKGNSVDGTEKDYIAYTK